MSDAAGGPGVHGGPTGLEGIAAVLWDMDGTLVPFGFIRMR